MLCIRFFLLHVCFSIFYAFSDALYEDQAGSFDWRQQYVGRVKFLMWDQSRQIGKRIFVGTEKNVVASINIQTGALVWRQLMESQGGSTMDSLLHHTNVLITLSGAGYALRGWNPTTGHLQWEQHLPLNAGQQHATMTWATGAKDQLVVLTSHVVAVYLVSNGKQLWNVTLPSSDTIHYGHAVSHDDDITITGVSPASHVIVLRYTNDGDLDRQLSVPAPWISTRTPCHIVGAKYLVCYDRDSASFYVTNIRDDSTFLSVPLQSLGVSGGDEVTFHPVDDPELGADHLVARLSPAHVVVLRITGQTVTVAKDLPHHTSAWVGITDSGPVVLAARRESDELVSLTAYDLTTGGQLIEFSHSLNAADFHGNVEMISPLFFKKRDGRSTYRAILTFSDYSIQMVQTVGKIGWRREEALSYVVAVEMVDLPLSENDAKFEDEFGSHETDVLAMFLKRVRTQISQLKTFVGAWVQRLTGHKAHSHSSHQSEEFVETEETELLRDQFNLHKMVVMVTSIGKIYGMLSASGKIVWQQLLPDLSPFDHSGKPTVPVFIQRSSSHFPHPPQCAILGRHRVTGRGLLFVFNPVTGETVSDLPPAGEHLPYTPIQAVMASIPDESFLKGIVLMDTSRKLHTYPTSHMDLLSKHVSSMYLYNADVDSGIITGYRIASDHTVLQAEQVWSLNLRRSEQVITNVVGKRAIEHVHSQGRVLGDRSVLYKYLNPNLIAVTTEGTDNVVATSSAQKGPNKFLGVYLIDSITGRIVFQANHKRVTGPFHLVHSENWIVYNYYNQKSRRGEMAVLELYEGKQQSNVTVFSSFHASHQPLVMRQAYIFSQPISAMAASITEKGIASKTIIMALKNGGLLSLQKAYLDPRRPVIPTQEHMEEGTLPYMPEIGVSFDAIFNYNQSVFNIHSIHTAPAGLESTCLVLTYGIDIFFSHVMPSKLFDVLNEDFDYIFISSVLAGMFIVSVITQNLASRKALSTLWK